ncbi:unnamed protein product, partial [Polarella glacialis]
AKRAAVLIPGTQTPADCVTDLRALPVCVKTEKGKVVGWAHRGMLRQATAIVRVLGSVIERLEKEGYQVIFVGHSLGAGVAALAGAVLRLGLEGPKSTKVRSLCYATPACGNASLGRYCEAHAITVINCDDIVPRLSLETARKLRAELEERREAVRLYVQQDISALKDVQNVTEKKTRSGASRIEGGDVSAEGAETAKELISLGIPAPKPGTEAQAAASSTLAVAQVQDVKVEMPQATPKSKPQGSFFCCGGASGVQ